MAISPNSVPTSDRKKVRLVAFRASHPGYVDAFTSMALMTGELSSGRARKSPPEYRAVQRSW
uniref:Uncharacterized protein n=1 Tax=Arundo donax TaxID=35708 RepID=A0A0A8YHJ6_ARUDO